MAIEATGRITIEVSGLGLSDERVQLLQGQLNHLQAELFATTRQALPDDVRSRIRWTFDVDGETKGGGTAGDPDDVGTAQDQLDQVAAMLRQHLPEEVVQQHLRQLRQHVLDDDDQTGR
jgi:hypothetical protein